MEEDIPYLTGQLLLALPGMGDPRFERSVIAMCLHDSEGAMGIDISHEHDAICFDEVLAQILSDDAQLAEVSGGGPAAGARELLAGGPVEPQRGFVIHSLDYELSDTIPVAGRFGVSTAPGIVVDMGTGKGPETATLALGYAGWGPGQLDEEMKRNGWIALDIDLLPLIALPAGERWAAALRQGGIEPALLNSGFGSA